MEIVPFTIEPDSKGYILSKIYEEENSFKLAIPKNHQIEEPIIIKIKPTGADLSFILKVELAEGSSAVIMEHWPGEVLSEKVDFKLQIEGQANSNLKYIILNTASDKTEMKEERITAIEADATCEIYSYYLGAKKVESVLIQKAMGRAAEVNTDIMARSAQEQELIFNCEHQFIGQNGLGQINMKAVAQDKGMVKLEGMVNILHSGGGSAGYLQQETLNLSPFTTVKATPGLKIDTNDVKAGHGSSIRNLNEEDLFYFSARGIEEEMAKNLLISGFLGSELKKLDGWERVYEEVKRVI